MTQTVRYLTCAETAALLRAALKESFPGVKFSVRSETYSLGASIRVQWTDGPMEQAVHAVANRFQGSDFNGLDDSTTGRPPTEVGGQLVSFGADHVFVRRDQSTEVGTP